VSPMVRRTLQIALEDNERALAGWARRRDEARDELTLCVAQVAKLEQTVVEIERALAEDPEQEGSTDAR
jgi:hypothetical protein